MTDVTFNLQDHLRDMEKRIRTDIVAGAVEVKQAVAKQEDRLSALEQSHSAHLTRTRWLIRSLSALGTAILTWITTHLVGHP